MAVGTRVGVHARAMLLRSHARYRHVSVRLNFGCPLPTLERGVARFAEAVRAARAK